MIRQLRGTTVVITGASSGIGRAAALSFARRGANLVLAARGLSALGDAADACRRLGARVLAVPTDTSAEEQVRQLAAQALAEFGRIDVWVNDAAVVLFGRFLDVPSESFRRVVETNLMGYVHGARAALSQFSRQRSGVLINVASVLGKEGIPYLSSYVAAKEGIIGLSACLREELKNETDVHVCTILPAAVDTPIWQHGGNYTGRKIQPLPPVYDPQDVADTIVSCAEAPRRIVYVGTAGRAVTTFHGLLPTLYERIAGRVVDKLMFQHHAAANADGNLFTAATPPMRTYGGWGRRGRGFGLATAAGVLAASALAVWYWLRPEKIRPRAMKTFRKAARKIAA